MYFACAHTQTNLGIIFSFFFYYFVELLLKKLSLDNAELIIASYAFQKIKK
jgi:hypothetical protein